VVPAPKRKVSPLYRRYEGILAEPRDGIDLPPLDQFADHEVPSWFRTVAPEKVWPKFISQLKAAHLNSDRDLALRLAALRKFFGIKHSYAGWIRDLALTLALRHERKKFAGPDKVSYASLFIEHGLNPEREDDEYRLLLALAGKHVPGFRFKKPEFVRGRLDDEELSVLILGFGAAIHDLDQDGQRVSANAIANRLTNEKFLNSIEPFEFSKDLKRVLKELANAERGRGRSASNKTLRNYWRAWKSAPDDLRDGKLSRLQLQMLRVCRML
jgi:hypothetical protein